MTRTRRTPTVSKDELDWQARELGLYIDSDFPLYQRKLAWFKSMYNKYKKGKFDPVKAEKGFAYLTTEAARKYNNEGFGSEFKIGTAAHTVVNKELVAEFLSAVKNKDYDFMR